MKKELILGISLGFNSSACILDSENNVLYAASEERFTNVKNCKFFPILAIKNGIEFLGIDPKDIAFCYYSHYQDANIYDMYRHTYQIDTKIPQRPSLDISSMMEKSFIEQHLYMLGVDPLFIHRVDHHEAHAYCSRALTPFHDGNNLYVVMDGFGDGKSISFWMDSKGEGLKNVCHGPMQNSVALVYQFVTGALGYKEHQHEGKITGLAAFGDPTKYYNDFINLYDGFKKIHRDIAVQATSPIIDFDLFLEMKRRTYDFVNDIMQSVHPDSRFEESKHIAASLQAFAEDKVIEYIGNMIKNLDLDNVNVMLSGGLFANVKINQKVHENIPQVQNIFVAPPMGDEGTCIGAASYKFRFIEPKAKMTNMTMRIGTSHPVSDIHVDDDLEFEVIESIEEVAKAIAMDLSKNEIVCLFDGRMEFGPRALIGRTIMYNCRDKGANDWLNKQLGRTEFMPFAPFCKEENARDLFYNVDGKEYALKNMTVTVDCTEEFIQNYPAACHVDNTARPQVISSNENELAWTILDEYEAITGEKALINTSFNLHNYPIIESPEVAISSWKQSNTQSLYIGRDGTWYKITRK